jgi:hypothetical protein
MELKGGNESLADGNPVALGDTWIDSLGSYEEWRTFGFGPSSLVPIIKFLPNDLREACEELLKQYFVRNLVSKNTGVSGHTSAENKSFVEKELKYSDGKRLDRELAKNSTGLKKIVVTAQGHVDGLQLTYGLYSGPGGDWSFPKTTVSGRYGRDRGTDYDFPAITFEDDEFISGLEVWVDEKKDKGTLRAMAVRTSYGKRWPGDTGFYGTNQKKGDSFYLIEAPRVRALRGYVGDFIHALGLGYLDLATKTSRNFLLAMEPYLFPTGDFGPPKK